eukprot:TRINITY_DN55039_c0_g1_i1.p1 TRINITY_DN55039_c0_g1~~TRINITY_DN55039_c0_g1_i1.p1  ORF type:complete len:584 (+),score=130.71 TRINITY_DN55039_c0_g1_i1:55-1806(+)
MAASPTSSMAQQAAATPLQDYQRNTAFVGFMLLVCPAGLVYLTRNLAKVFTPLIWAAFAAMPLTGLIKVLNPLVIKATRCCWGRGYREVRCQSTPSTPSTPSSAACADMGLTRQRTWGYHEDDVEFSSRIKEDFIIVDQKAGQDLTDELNEPDWCLLPKCFFIPMCCRRRARVKDLVAVSTQDKLSHREVNRIVEGWQYYVRIRPGPRPEGLSPDEMALELFLDDAEHYPAIVEVDDEALVAVKGKLEVDTTHTVSYTFAAVSAFTFIMVLLAGFAWLISVGAASLSDNVGTYVRGGKEMVDEAATYMQKVLPKEMTRDLDKKALELLNTKLPEMTSGLLAMVEGLGFEILLFVLYLLFWTLEPLPVSSQVSGLFRTYLLQKSLVCLIFGALMSGLLLFLKCPLWHILFLVAFFLNYIPEVGPVVCFVIMLPLILLDGNQTINERSWNSVTFTIMFLVFKFVTGNIIEVQLYAKSGGDLMRMHPVVMLALMMLFQSLMGMTGMFMTVPAVAAAKYYVLSMNMPPSIRDPLLTCIEGTEYGPHMNYVEQMRAEKRDEAKAVQLSSNFTVVNTEEPTSESGSDSE